MRLWLLQLSLLLLCACSASVTRPQLFDPDVYYLRRNGAGQGTFYCYPAGDSVRLYALQPRPGKGQPRPQAKEVQAESLPIMSLKPLPKLAFYIASLDVDAFTAPIKYRPATPEYPHQLQPVVNLNGYVGYRVDRFRYRYKQNPAGFYNRSYKHIGLSIGGFTGMGSEHIFPEVLSKPITGEYDGWIWSKGGGIFLGVQQLTVGLLAGSDQLLDRNRKYWLYRDKLWIGLGLGVNLN